MRYFFLLSLIFVSTLASTGGSSLHAQVDSSYIGGYKLQTALNIGFSKDFLSLEHEFKNGDSRTYTPNNPMGIGVGLSMYNTVLSLDLGRGFNFMRDKKKGKTKSFDFQMHSYGRKLYFDIFIQRYKGFYVEGGDDKLERIDSELEVRQYSGNIGYLFNNKKFSYSAAFNHSEKQLKSAGSFMLGMEVAFTRMRSDSLIVRNQGDETGNTFRNFQIGFNAGYAHSFALGRYWLLSISTTVGLNFGSSKISRFGKDKLELYPSVFPRVAASYNHEKWSASFSYLNKVNFLSFRDDAYVGMLSGKFQLSYVYRIHDIPLLSKMFR